LRDYLESNDIECYTQTRKNEVSVDPNTGLFNPYVILTSTPATLQSGDFQLAGNEHAPRTAYLTAHCIGNLRTDGIDDGGELLEEVNSLLEYGWQPSDGERLLPMSSYTIDAPYTLTEVPRITHSQRYKVHINTR